MTDKLEIAESTLFQAREKVLWDEIKSLRRQLAEYQVREKATPKSNYEKGVFNPVFDSPPEHTAEELK
jgi:hypothetical protein